MPEVVRNRFRNPSSGQDYDGANSPAIVVRPGFGPDEDPLAELARIVGEAAPPTPVTSQRQPMGQPRATPATASRPLAANLAPRDYPRRDTSWRDPQARTTVRAGVTPQPMPGQLADLEAELFSEISSENLRSLPPAPDLADLGLADARLPQYADMQRIHADKTSVTGSESTINTSSSARPAVSRAAAGMPPASSGRGDADDEVTLPMNAVLRAMPPSASAWEDTRMPQSQRVASEPEQAFSQGRQDNAGHDDYNHVDDRSDHVYPGDGYHEAVDLRQDAFDPAGALAGNHAYQSDAEYYAAVKNGYAEADQAYADYPSLNAHHEGDYGSTYYDEIDDGYGQPHVAPDVDRGIRMKRRNPALVGVAAIVGLLVIGVGGFLTYRAVASSSIIGGSVPLIRADGKPVKELVAQQPVSAPGPNLDTARPEGQDKLVTQTEDPVDHVPGKPTIRVVGPGAQNPSLAPVQRVRSVIVRPDGTIVTPDDAGAKPDAAPPVRTAALSASDNPVVPPAATKPVPSGDGWTGSQVTPMTHILPVSPSQSANASLLPLAPVKQIEPVPVATKPNPAPPVAAAPKSAAPPVAAAQKPAVSQTSAHPKPVASTPLAPAQRAPASGSNAPLSLGPSSGPAQQPPVRVANAPIAQPSAPAAPRAVVGDVGSGDYMVQISSQRSDAEARRAVQAAEQKYASLGIKGGDVQQAEVAGRGTYYRARLAAGSHEQAVALCAQIKAQGGDCVVAKR